MCGTEEATSENTCRILQQVYDECGNYGHSKNLSALLSQANCPTTIPTTTTTAPTTRTRFTPEGKYGQFCVCVCVCVYL